MPWSVERNLQLNVLCCMLPLYLGSLSARGLGSKGPRTKWGASQFFGNISISSLSLSKAGDSAVWIGDASTAVSQEDITAGDCWQYQMDLCSFLPDRGVSSFSIPPYLQSVTYTYSPFLGWFAAVSLFLSIGSGVLLRQDSPEGAITYSLLHCS